MSLPPVTALKDQARRLIGYLGDHHRFRLRESSALEAVARIWRQPDWNTLQALSARGHEAPAGAVPAQSRMTTYALDWGPSGPRFEVPANDWRRHTLVLGSTAHARRAWLLRQLAVQVERGGAGVFVNIFGGPVPDELRHELQTEVALLDLGDPAGAGEYNILGDLSADAAASLLLQGVVDCLGPGDNIYKRVVHGLLELLIASRQARGAPVTFERVLADLRAVAAERDDVLPAQGPGSEQRLVLAALWEQAWTGSSFQPVMCTLLERTVVSRLAQWAQVGGLSQLLAENPDAPSLRSSFLGSKCVLIELAALHDPLAVQLQGVWLATVAREALNATWALPHTERGVHARVLGLAEVHTYHAPGLLHMLEQGRAVGWTQLMTAPQEEASWESWVTGNVWNRLYLDKLPPRALADVTARLREASSVAMTPGSVRYLPG